MNMKKLFQVLLLALLASFSVHAQTAGTRANGIEFVASLPGTCNPAQGKTLGVVGTPVRYYNCTATNTWSEITPTAQPASTVNFLGFSHGATGNPVTISSSGSNIAVPIRLNPQGGAYPNGPGVVFPVNTRFDDTGLKFAGFESSGIGIGLKAGGSVFEITSSKMAFAGNELELQGSAVLSFGTTGTGWSSGINTPDDDPPGRNTAIEKGTKGVLGFVAFDGNPTVNYVGGTWRARPNSPAQITGQVNNYNPGAPSYFQRWNTNASQQVTGLTFTTAQVSGQVHQIWNIGAQDIVLVHESASSLAANRFLSTTGTNLTLTPNQCANALYDADSARWRIHLCN